MDTIAYKLRNRINQKCMYISLAGARESKKQNKTVPIFYGKGNLFQSTFLKCGSPFPQEPIQHITGALGVPCCPWGGLECFYLQFMALIQIRARLNLNSECS